MNWDEVWGQVATVSIMTGGGGFLALLGGTFMWDHEVVIHGGTAIILSMCAYAIATKKLGV